MSVSPRLPAATITRDQALSADLHQFPNDPLPGTVSSVASGASGRRFFRIQRGQNSRILMAYPEEPHENQLFTGIAGVLDAQHIPVPAIIADAPEKGLVWIEDLGGQELYSLRERQDERRNAYEQALRALDQLQNLPAAAFSAANIETLPPFDEHLYHFEHQYFLEELHSRLHPGSEPSPALETELDQLRERLLAATTTWIHRDFQSKNLMVDPKGQIRLVDFQGIRHGHPYYDLASLLCDPYVNLPSSERTHLFRYFCDLRSLSPEEEAPTYAAAACQRLMQALGAYGRFGLGGGVQFFSDKIPTALTLLQHHAKQASLPETERLSAALLATFADGSSAE